MNTIQRKSVRVLDRFHLLSVANGSTLGKLGKSKREARMIRQARRVGEGCERLLFRQTFCLSKQAGRFYETVELRKEECSSKVVSVFPFLFRTSGGKVNIQ